LRLKRRFLLIPKTYLIGTVFLLFSTVLSPVAAQDTFHPCSAKEEQISTTSYLSPDGEWSPIETLALPTDDDPNDDLILKILLKEQPKEESDFDIPIVINAKVEQFIQYFQTTIRDRFATWLARSEKYIPFMKNLLKEHGLPEDLVYMALIESGFDPYAYSRSKASGLWQFIRWTGKKYCRGIQDHQSNETLSDRRLLETDEISLSETGDQKLCSPDDCSRAHCQGP